MMGSSAGWTGQSATATADDDDFQHYLELNGMGDLAEGLQFDLHGFGADFQSAAAATIMPPQHERQQQQVSTRQQQQQRLHLHHHHHHHHHPMDTPMTGTDMPALLTLNPEPQSHMIGGLSATGLAPPTTQAPPTPSEAINDIDAKIQFLQQQRLQQQQRQLEEQQVAFFARQSRLVPPTPQSLDIQAGSRYYVAAAANQTPQQGMYERFQQQMGDQQDMSFTPLVSPAVTPLETHFSMESQFTIPGAYFSPLASPALHAQAEGVPSIFDQVGSAKKSPPAADMDLETSIAAHVTPSSLATEAAAAAKKSTRKSAPSKARGKGSVRQSPIFKPQRKKTQTTPSMNPQAISELAESLQQSQETEHLLPPPAPHGHAGSPIGLTDSEDGPISPETLSEMPPPPLPKPRSNRPSPHIEARGGAPKAALSTLQGTMSPATPASLMRLTSPSGSIGTTPTSLATLGAQQDPIENFELPESVHFRDSARRDSTTAAKTPTESPRLGPLGATAFQALPPPKLPDKAAAIASASQSPLLVGQQQQHGGSAGSAAATPTLAAAAARRTPQLGARSGKKRASISSTHPSPALRPRISPNIKPLLPGGGGGGSSSEVEDAASRLLASKSNYQNILEGNSVPGVSYPSELSTNLTSKRTSHKLAEQGRRNRINQALTEMANLLPQPTAAASSSSSGGGGGGGGTGGGGDDEGEEGAKKGSGAADKQGGGGAGGPNSKASTVEMAIEYIKMLKKEVADANRRAEEAERKLQLHGAAAAEEEMVVGDAPDGANTGC